MPSEDSAEGGKRFGFYLGTVTENADPQKLGRARIKIEGLIEKTGWALPMGSPGGGGTAAAGQRRGMSAPVSLGALVVVGFLQGDVDSPIFWPANFGIVEGASQVPGPVGGYSRVDRDTAAARPSEDISPDDALKVFAYESANFVVVIDDRPGKEKIVLESKETGDRVQVMKRRIEIRALDLMLIECDGTLNINAGQLNLNGKALVIGTKPT